MAESREPEWVGRPSGQRHGSLAGNEQHASNGSGALRLPRDAFGCALRGANSVFDAMGYFRILTEAGLTVDAWETAYLHVLNGQDPVLRWTSGTALRPVLPVLGDADAQAFTSQYAGLLRVAYPAESAGRVILAFRRVFAVARREERV